MSIKSIFPLSFRQYWGKKIFKNKYIANILAQRNFTKLKDILNTLDKSKPVEFDRYNISVFSQAGEDGILALLINLIPIKQKYCVEFGVEDATECNTRLLIEKYNWNYLHMDGCIYAKPRTEIKSEFITPENINFLFEKYQVPFDLDILCVDIDYSTYYVLQAISQQYKPSIIVVEYNASLGSKDALVVNRDDNRMWDGTLYFGASIQAYTKLLNKRGYSLVYCDQMGISSFFILNELASKLNIQSVNDAEALFRQPKYGIQNGEGYTGHPPAKEGDIFLVV